MAASASRPPTLSERLPGIQTGNKRFVLTRTEIRRIERTAGAGASLAYIGLYGYALTQPPWGYARDQIDGIAAHNGGSQALQAVCDHHDALVKRYPRAEILFMASRHGGAAGLLKKAAGVA
jgi:hypothetical protein